MFCCMSRRWKTGTTWHWSSIASNCWYLQQQQQPVALVCWLMRLTCSSTSTKTTSRINWWGDRRPILIANMAHAHTVSTSAYEHWRTAESIEIIYRLRGRSTRRCCCTMLPLNTGLRRSPHAKLTCIARWTCSSLRSKGSHVCSTSRGVQFYKSAADVLGSTSGFHRPTLFMFLNSMPTNAWSHTSTKSSISLKGWLPALW